MWMKHVNDTGRCESRMVCGCILKCLPRRCALGWFGLATALLLLGSPGRAGEIYGWEYGPSAWTALGSGTTGTINAILADASGLYVGGVFTEVGGGAATNVAFWDSSDSTWAAMGVGLTDPVTALLAHESEMYAALGPGGLGIVDNAIARWESGLQVWTNLGSNFQGGIYALEHDGDAIYVGGLFILNGLAYIGKWDPSTAAWTDMGGGVTGIVHPLLFDGSNLYVGGEPPYWINTQRVHVSTWNSASELWSALPGELDGIVAAFATDGQYLYVGGTFTAIDEVVVNGIARWDLAAEEWSSLGDGMNGDVKALLYDGTNLFAGGSFTEADGVQVNHIAMWEPASETWSALASGMDAPVTALASDGFAVYAGGPFTNAGATAVNRIAAWGPSLVETSGVEPGSGPWRGGTTVRISGADLGDGSDITNVTLAGVAAVIVSQSATDVVVTTGRSTGLGMGDVRVYSASLGESVRTNGFEYTGPTLTVESLFDAGAPAVGVFTNDFGVALTNRMATFATVGTTQGVLTGWTMTGNEPASGVTNEFVMTVTNDAVLTWQWSVNTVTVIPPSAPFHVGPYQTSQRTITLTNGIFGTITNVLVGGVRAIIVGSGRDWVTVVVAGEVGPGAVDIVIQTSDNGTITLTQAYVVNPPGEIGWVEFEPQAWTNLASGVSANGSPYALLAVGSDVYIGGAFTIAGGVSVNNVAHWDSSARRWYALGSGVNAAARAFATDGTNIYVGGDFTTAGGVSAKRVAKWDPVAKSWSALGDGLNGAVAALAFDGTNLYAGGKFSSAGAVAANGVAMWDGIAEEWVALGDGVNSTGFVRAAVWDGEGLVIGGQFTNVSGVAAANVARYSPASGVWSAMGSGIPLGAGRWVAALAAEGADVYAGGTFTAQGGSPGNGIAKWDAKSGQWLPLDSGTDGSVYGITSDGDHLYIVGDFASAGGEPRKNIARWSLEYEEWGDDMDGGLSSFTLGAIFANGYLYVAGNFTNAGGASASHVARWWPGYTLDYSGVEPESGPTGGGYLVTIVGSNLGDGTDVERVTLADVDATILSQSATQIVVRAGATPEELWGNVVVYSVNFGETVRWDAFSYENTPDAVLLEIVGDHDAGLLPGGVYGFAVDSAVTNWVAPLVTQGNTQYVAMGWTLSGNEPPSGEGNEAAIVLTNNAVLTWQWATNLVQVEPAAGPLSGGNRVTFTNGIFGQITNVTVDGETVAILGSGSNWVTVIMPGFPTAGAVEVVVQTADHGDVIMTDAYAANPAGRIVGSAPLGPDGWSPVGEGVGYPIRAMTFDGTNLFAGGDKFGYSVSLKPLVKWDPRDEVWSNVGGNFSDKDVVYALAHDGVNLYAAGILNYPPVGGAMNIVSWNTVTETWDAMQGGIRGDFSYVTDLAFDGTALYAVGSFETAGGKSAANIARWDPASQTWSPLGSGIKGGPGDYWWIGNSLASGGSNLYVGGSFGNAGGVSARNVARWDIASETWTNMGQGLPSGPIDGVEALAYSESGDLFAGGVFTNAVGEVYYLARWIEAEEVWTNFSGVVDGYILALASEGSDLYVGGDFTNAVVSYIAKWDAGAEAWTNLGGGMNGKVFSLLYADGYLYAGGSFTKAGGTPAANIAKWGPTLVETSGIKPERGSWLGGYPVVISGENLGNGSDITNVSLAGIDAEILSQSATRVVVEARASAQRGLGDVRIYSTSFGETVSSNTFEYTGVELTIASAHGVGTPAPGAYAFAGGEVLTNGMSAVEETGATQYVLIGWTMAGNEPLSGVGTQVVMTLSNDAALVWNWGTNFWLSAIAGAHGQVSPPAGWQAGSANVSVSAMSETYYHFAEWTGDVYSTENPVDVWMDGPKELFASFAENVTANTGTPEWWLAQHGFTNDFEAAALADPDGDRVRTADEWIMNTDPNDGASYLYLESLSESAAGELTWPARPDRVYDVEFAPQLTDDWQAAPGLTNLVTAGEFITVTNLSNAGAQGVYRVRVRLP